MAHTKKQAAKRIVEEERAAVHRAIENWVRVGGDLDGQIEAWRVANAGDVPRRTFYRWLADARLTLSGKGQQAFLGRVAERQVEVQEQISAVVGEIMPKVITADDLAPITRIGAIGKLNEAIAHCDKVIAQCYAGDGKIRNAKVLLAASNNMVRAVESLNRIAESMYDATRIEAAIQAMTDEIGKIDLDTSHRILNRLSVLLDEWDFMYRGPGHKGRTR